MADTATETDAPDGLAGGSLGSMDDLLDSLGLPEETPEEAAAMARGDDVGPARAKAKEPAGDKADKTDKAAAKAKPEAEDKPEKDEEVDPEDAALAEWEAVRKRSRERREARRAEARGTAPAAAAAPVEEETVDEPEADAAPAKGQAAARSEVQAAAADIIAAIAKLDEDDEVADAAATTGKDAKGLASTAKREAMLAALSEKLGVLVDAVESSAKMRDEYGQAAEQLRQRVQDFEDLGYVENLAETTIDRMETKLPLLSKHRNASKLVVRAASSFLERKGKAAPLGFIAESVERALARRAGGSDATAASARGNGTSNGAPTKQSPSRKTVSAELATPPSRRQRDDSRSPKQVEEDLWNSLGIDPEA